MFEFSWKDLIKNSWMVARYGNWRNAFDAQCAKELGRAIRHCANCNLSETYPIDILGETVAIFKDNEVIDYCFNCAGEIYKGKVWDCLTGELVIIEKIDRYYILKYKLKLIVLYIWIVLRFIYEVPRSIFLWKIVLPIRKLYLRKQNEVQNRPNSKT